MPQKVNVNEVRAMSNVLVIDVGTQSMRGIIFDDKGTLLAKHKIKYPPYVCEQNGYVEQDVDMYWEVLCCITNALANDYPHLMDSVIGMTIDTFRDTSVLLDENNRPVRRAIIWSDQREADTSKKLPLFQRVAFGLAGVSRSVEAIRRKSKTSWVKQNEPQTWSKVRKVVLISAYLNYKVTGVLTDSVASTLGHLPFDFKRRRWLKKHELTFPVYDLPLDMMVPVVQPGEVIGKVTQSACMQSGIKQGLTVYAVGSDKGCETLGVGALGENVASVSFGTSCSVQLTTKKYFEPEPLMPAYPAVLKDYYNPEVQIFRGYWTVQWFIDNFAQDLVAKAQAEGGCAEDYLNEEIKGIPAGCDGLVLQPFWQAGLTNPEAKGAIIGFSDCHTRAHMYRAIVEGLDFALREGLERMEKRGHHKITAIAISGGGSQSDVLCQIAANVFNRPVRRVQTYETSGLGAAIATFTACGVFSDVTDAVSSMVHYTDEFLPDPNAAKVYDDIYKNVYLKMYSNLEKIYRHIYK